MEAILYLSETPQASDVLQKIRAELTSAIRNALLQHAYDSDIELSFGVVHINSKKKYDDEATEIEKKLTVEKAKKTQLDDVLSLSNEWLGAIRQAESVVEIDSDLVKHLVSSVKIFNDNRVEVELNFAEQRNVFNLIIAEMAGDKHE